MVVVYMYEFIDVIELRLYCSIIKLQLILSTKISGEGQSGNTALYHPEQDEGQ